MRIFTGALVPEGGARVIPQELAAREMDRVTFAGFPENRFIRRKGVEAKPGDVVVAAGTRLGATELAMLAQVGAVEPQVTRLPVIQHVATGEELVGPDQAPSEGMIRNTNSTLLEALVAAHGGAFGNPAAAGMIRRHSHNSARILAISCSSPAGPAWATTTSARGCCANSASPSTSTR